MLVWWLKCDSLHPEPVVVQDSVKIKHFRVLRDDGGPDQLRPSFVVWGEGSGPATGKARTGAGIGMLRWLKAQLDSLPGRQVSRFLFRNLIIGYPSTGL